MKIEKKNWEAPILLDLNGDKTEVGTTPMFGLEGTHFMPSFNAGVS